MDRIRKNSDNRYEVLITPRHRFNSSVEYILGGWTDARLKGFKVEEYDNLEDAQVVAFNQPSLDWKYLVSLNQEPYNTLYREVKESLREVDMVYDFSGKLLNNREAKDVMFDRVKMYGHRFRLCYNYNDLITFKIVNPWTKNIKEIASHLKLNKNLKLIREYSKNGVMYLIGQTDTNTTYEIILCTSLVDHWTKWVQLNKHLPNDIMRESLSDILDQQERLDSSFILR